MRLFSLTVCATFMTVTLASAQSDRIGLAPAYLDATAANEALHMDVIFGKLIAPVPMSEWEVDAKPTKRIPIAQGTGTGKYDVMGSGEQVIPANASRYDAKAFVLPSGTIRVLTFKKGQGGVLHRVTFETAIFVLQGTVEIGVAGTPTKVSTGDAVYLPSGDMRNDHPSGDTIIVQFFLTSQPSEKSVVVRGKDTVASPIAEWMDSGKPLRALSAEDVKKAPKNAARLTAARYVFGNNSIRLVNLKKGGKTNPENHTGADAILYMTKGHMRRFDGDQTFDVVAGDVVREGVGKPGQWEVLEDSTFIVTDAPR